MAAFDEKDGGWQSRKLHLTLFTQVLIFVGAILAGHYALMGPHYEMMVGGLIACLGAFLGVNVASKWTIGKNINARSAMVQTGPGTEEDEEESKKDEESVPASKPKTLSEMAHEQDAAKHRQ